MKFRSLLLSALIFLVTAPVISTAQELVLPKHHHRPVQLETSGDEYLSNAHNNQKTSPSHVSSQVTLRNTTVFTKQVNVNAEGENIVDDAANEPSIAFNPLNPNEIVIGWRQFDNINSNFRQAGWSYSADGGQTWTFPGVLEPGIFRSDPVLNFDADGQFYYNSLTVVNGDDFQCKVFRSDDGGATWDDGIDAFGGDKQWMAIDRTGGVGSGNIYSYWSKSYSICQPGHFTRSTDGGDSYESCVEVDGQPYWGNMAVGKDGELYIVGSNYPENLLVVKSLNAQDPGSAVEWDFSVVVDVNGEIGFGGDVNPDGLLGQAHIDVDRSEGPGQGNVYVLASVYPLSGGDPGDVMFASSADGGLTWNDAIKVNDDASNSNTQWFGTMSVAPNGRIDAVWLDTREADGGSDSSALYYSYSVDQGASWSVNEKISDLFNPHDGYPNQNKLGDYFDMISDIDGAHLAWANTLNGEQDVYYSRITPDVVAAANELLLPEFCLFPNPTSGLLVITASESGERKNENSPQIEISNAMGEIVWTSSIHQSRTQVDVSFLPAGFYLMRYSDGDDGFVVKKVVKE